MSVSGSTNRDTTGPDLALHISPPSSSCGDIRSSIPHYTTPNQELPEHIHGFDLWKKPLSSIADSGSNVSSPARPSYDNVGASTILCLANPPQAAAAREEVQENRYLHTGLAHQFLVESSPSPSRQDFPRTYSMYRNEDFARRAMHSYSVPPVPELSLGRVEALPLPRPDLPKFQSYHMVGRDPGMRYSGYYGYGEDVSRQGGRGVAGMQGASLSGNLSSLLEESYNAKHDGIYGSLAFRSRFPLKSPSKRSIRAPRMRWTTALHTHFVQAVELLGGHESKFSGYPFMISLSYVRGKKIFLLGSRCVFISTV